MDLEDFINKIKPLKTVINTSGSSSYNNISITSSSVNFVRKNKKKSESIKISELFNFYKSGLEFTTTNAKSFISGRVQSPAVAILLAIDKNGDISKNDDIKPQRIKKENNKKDEVIFFEILSEVIGSENLISKSINRSVNSTDIFFSKNYKEYGFEDSINDKFNQFLKELNVIGEFPSDSLASYIDGLIINHPIYKSRIIEFDEEQHFTPARLIALDIFKEKIPNSNLFISYCKDIKYLNNDVLKKHRLKTNYRQIPTLKELIQWISLNKQSPSNYTKAEQNFNYLGGRISKRAYYDTLRDTAHLSIKNKELVEPIRFAKKMFEDLEGIHFNKIPRDRIKKIIVSELNKLETNV